MRLNVTIGLPPYHPPPPSSLLLPPPSSSISSSPSSSSSSDSSSILAILGKTGPPALCYSVCSLTSLIASIRLGIVTGWAGGDTLTHAKRQEELESTTYVWANIWPRGGGGNMRMKRNSRAPGRLLCYAMQKNMRCCAMLSDVVI